MGVQLKMSRLTLIGCFLACLFYSSCGSNDERPLQDFDERLILDYNDPFERMIIDRLKSSTKAKPLPSRLTFKTDIGVAPNLYQFLGSKQKVEQYVRNFVKYANEYFKLPSFETKLTIHIMKVKTNIDYAPLGRTDGGLADYKREGNYHLGVFGLSKMNRFRGLAHTGSACIWLDKNSTWNIKDHANFLVELKPTTILKFAAESLAHEIGHVIDMGHNDVTECGKVDGGVMNPGTYYQEEMKWTKCNIDDLEKYYSRRGYLCL